LFYILSQILLFLYRVAFDNLDTYDENISPVVCPNTIGEPWKKHRWPEVIALVKAKSDISELILSLLEKEMQERWPFLIHIDSLQTGVGADDTASLHIAKECYGATLQEVFDYYESANAIFPLAVSHSQLKISSSSSTFP
jgi:hypothetical protein